MAWIESHQIKENKKIDSFGPIGFKFEKEMEDFIVKNWKYLFDFTYFMRQYDIDSSSRADIVCYDSETEDMFVIELKMGKFLDVHMGQAFRYCRVLKNSDRYYEKFRFHAIVMNYIDSKIETKVMEFKEQCPL